MSANVAAASAGLGPSRLVKVRTGSRGGGWAVGVRGVLTARHVVVPFLAGAVDYCLAVPDPRPGAAEFGCTVVWHDEAGDLALLAVEQGRAAEWAALIGADTGPALAETGTGTLAVEAV